MINIKTLHYGCHVMAGDTHQGFAVPKHCVEIARIESDGIYCVCGNDPEQYKYGTEDLEGIELTDSVKILLNNGFFQSKLNENRYIYQNEITKDRIVINLDGVVTCNGTHLVERTGCEYLHQVETLINEANINFNFQVYGNR